MAVEMFSWPSLHERMCRTWGSNSEHAYDRATAPVNIKRCIIWAVVSESTWIIWKGDPLEIKYTYKVWKQHTRFDWVCSWQIMENATSLTPPCPGRLKRYSAFRCLNPIVPKGPENVKITTLDRCTCMETCHTTVVISLNNLKRASIGNVACGQEGDQEVGMCILENNWSKRLWSFQYFCYAGEA